MDYDTIFNTSGKIPTDSEFWHKDIDFGDERTGITKFYSKVLGEQVYHPNKSPVIRFYAEFAGRPLPAGFAWEERITKKTIAKHFNPKASASDDLQFYENGGYSWKFGLNVQGWKPVTLPSNLASLEDNLKPENVGTFNGILVDQVMKDYQRDMESAIGKKLISTAGNDKTITYGSASDLIAAINDIVTEMKGTKVHYNDVGNDPDGNAINDNIYTNSEEVLIFMDEKLSNWIKAQMGSLPSPDKVAIEGARIITLVDGLPTPITAAEFAAGVTAQGWDENEEPAAMGEAQPDIFICSKARCEYRPLVDSYRINLSKNGAGDFVNEHLIWKGGIAIRPWENALRVYLSYDESGTPVRVTNTEDDPVNTKDVAPRVPHSITYAVQPVGAGSATGLSSAVAGTEVTVTVNAESGYSFANLYSPQIPFIAGKKFTMPDEDVEIVAHFVALRNVTCIVSPDGAGTLRAEPNENLVPGETVHLEKSANTGYYFDHYESTDIDVGEIYYDNFGMPDSNVTITAVFTDTPPGEATAELLIYTTDGEYEFTPTESQTVVPDPLICGTENHISTAESVTKDGKVYVFEKWNIDATPLGSPIANFFVDARYVGETIPFDVTYERAYPVMLTIDPYLPTPTVYTYTALGRTWHVTATPVIQPGYHFVRWETTTPGLVIDSPTSISTDIHVPEELPASEQFDIKIVTEAD